MKVDKDAYTNNSNGNGNINTTTAMIQSRKWKSESRNELQDDSDLSDIRTDTKMETLDVRAPYFDDNNLKTVVSWFRNGLCNGTRIKYTIRLVLKMLILIG